MTVTICIPAYNAQQTLGDTVRSILAQTYRDIDIAIVDNASTDGTAQIARDFAAQDSRVRHLRFEELVSGHENFTRCFAAARGDLMAIYHADDIYHPTIVEDEVALLRRRPDIGAVFTKGRRVDGQGVPLPGPFPIPEEIFAGDFAVFDFPDALRAVLQYGHIFLTPSGMVRTDIYRNEIGRWPYPDFGGSADLFVFLSIARAHKIAILDKTLIDYRTSLVSASFRYARERRTRHDIFQTLAHFVERDGPAVMGPDDQANYEFLQLKDDINIAISQMIDGDSALARKLMPRLHQRHIVQSARRYQRHTKILILGYGVWFLSYMPLGRVGRSVLQRLRFG